MAEFTDKSAFSGETIVGTFSVPDGTTALVLKLADGVNTAEINATENEDGTWTANADAETLADFSGSTRWVAYATTADGVTATDSGKIYIRAIVSKYRSVIAQIETALESYSTNANKIITVGELSITYRDYDHLLGLLAYYRSKAEADEAGRERTGGAQQIRGRFVNV